MLPSFRLPSRPRFPSPGRLLPSGPQALLSSRRHPRPPPPTPRWPPSWSGSRRSQKAAKTKLRTPHAFRLQLFRHYGTSVSSLPQSPIRGQCTWVRSHAPSMPGVTDVLRTFLASPPPVQRVVDSPGASPAEAAAANQAEGAAKKKGYTPQKVDPQIFSKALWVG